MCAQYGAGMVKTGRNFFLRCPAVYAGLACALAVASAAHAQTLTGKKAAARIGDLKETLTGSEYYAVALERRNEDISTGNRVDAVIFSAFARTFKLIRRLDQDHALALNVTGGRQAPRVTAENFAWYRQLIEDNAMKPEVVLDKDGAELLIAYCGLRPCRIIASRKKDGRLNLEVRRFLQQREPDIFVPIQAAPAE